MACACLPVLWIIVKEKEWNKPVQHPLKSVSWGHTHMAAPRQRDTARVNVVKTCLHLGTCICGILCSTVSLLHHVSVPPSTWGGWVGGRVGRRGGGVVVKKSKRVCIWIRASMESALCSTVSLLHHVSVSPLTWGGWVGGRGSLWTPVWI